MKILYGLAGEGFGHSSRAKVIIPYLQKKGHSVKVITYGQAISVLKKEGFDIFEIKGMSIEFKKGKLDKSETVIKSLSSFFSNLNKAKEINEIMEEKFDLCITDMEPLTAILAALYKIKLLSIDNQHRITNLELSIPEKYKKDFEIAKFIIKSIVGRADVYIVTSYSKSKIKKEFRKNTYLVPPIIKDEVKKIKISKENLILVYLTKKNNRLLNILKKINEKFVVYGLEIEKRDKNLEFHNSGERFLKDLARCKAIIGTAGFTLISESLYLKKPYFAIPLHGQFEQILNALFIKDSDLGDYSDSANKKQIEYFLGNLENYEKKLKRCQYDYNLLFKYLGKVLRKAKLHKL